MFNVDLCLIGFNAHIIAVFRVLKKERRKKVDKLALLVVDPCQWKSMLGNPPLYLAKPKNQSDTFSFKSFTICDVLIIFFCEHPTCTNNLAELKLKN